MSEVIVSHPIGNANVRAAVYGLSEAALLNTFYTAVACFPDTTLAKLSRLPFLKEVEKRSYKKSIQENTQLYPWTELGRLISAKLGVKSFITHEKGVFSVDQVYHTLDRYVSKQMKNCEALYCYEDGAERSFIQAKKDNVKCFYDLPIGYWRAARRLLKEEMINRPEWASTITGFRDSEEKLARKDHELALADHIFVASSFTALTLQDYPGTLKEISIIPYGFPKVADHREYADISKRPLRLLFVGGLSQRKGIANLFEAVKNFGDQISLTIIGKKMERQCEALEKQLVKHRYIPSLPHSLILEEMKAHDVFVFPSLFEGFGLVITEAMSQGTPVITTERTAGPDIITHDVDGWIVKAGSSEALSNQIEALLSNPEMIERVGRAALNKAEQRPWEVYSAELVNKIGKLLNRE